MRNFLANIIAMMALLLSAGVLRAEVRVGAERAELYSDMLTGKRIALFSNHTGVLPDGRHTLDALLADSLDVRVLLSPEHGFRGTADAGESVAASVDPASGLPVVSLYDRRHRGALPAAALDGIDVIVCDIQDVGLRFYTYYITMLELMRGAARAGLDFVVLDRPNPNGMYVDGPILDVKLQSGVGRLPIPVVHGMTLGELARMICGEGWLGDGLSLALTVVPCEGYTHATRYALPVPPSPNLRSMQAIYLYPSVCLFEGTAMSLGRGTDRPFEMYGHPDYRGGEWEFVPRAMPGAKQPPLRDRRCRGVDLAGVPQDSIIARGVDLSYVIDAYRNTGLSAESFFTSFFDRLIGRDDIRGMIVSGMSADDIRATWADDVSAFMARRAPYLLYPEQ